jgi:hypothetical protein
MSIQSFSQSELMVSCRVSTCHDHDRLPPPSERSSALSKGIPQGDDASFWAANQLWPDLPQATLFNDIAIALFVLDVFLVIIGWPTTSPDESFAETYIEKPQEKSKARAASPTRNELALRAAEGRQRSALSNRPEKSPHQFNRPA